jgi:hypothetical protein
METESPVRINLSLSSPHNPAQIVLHPAYGFNVADPNSPHHIAAVTRHAPFQRFQALA